MGPVSPSPAPPTAEVSWQTCFWIIITLALNSMAQPSGRICDTPSHHRIYIRSSPVSCALDLVSILTRLVFVSWKLKVSPRTSLQLLIRRRFDDSDAEESANGTWLRWLLFVLGPLPQAIRLASFEGMTWTKIIGFIFLANFVVGEVLIILALKDIEYTLSDFQLEREVNQSMEMLDSYFKWIGIMSNLSAYYMYELSFVTDVNNIWIIFLYCYVSLALPCFSLNLSGVVCIIMEEVSKKHHSVVRNLMLVVPQNSEDVLEIYKPAVVLLVLFFLNLVHWFLGYRFLYDPSGTVNPGWTGAFG